MVVVLLGGAVAFLIFGSQASDAFVYSKFVNEVLVKPEAFIGRELRVEGNLEFGSVKFRQDPCEWRFALTSTGSSSSNSLPVRFPQCVVPDTFRDGMGITVTVQGSLQDDGWFVANQVIPRCPSRYEMDERRQEGFIKPHDR
ncbi:MAG: cytochrome c maturation protein CcmE [Deltaproteobacteria bacterium]|nr:cytochrome c maturation protein CcmE [Deltaproteobacteria bacterium]